jgi:ATP-binding cassette subfamily B protein
VSSSAPSSISPWSYLRRYRRHIGGGVVMLVATNLLFLGIPVTMGNAVAALRDGQGLDRVPTLALWMIGFAITTALTRIYSRVWIFNAARAAEYDLRSNLFAHLLRMEPAYFRTHPTGDVMSRLTSDVQTVRAMWGAGILNLLNTAFAFVPVVFMMVRVDPWLTLVTVLPYPTIYLVGQAMGRRIYRSSYAVQTELGKLSSKLQEDLSAIHLIKNYGLEDNQRKQFVVSSLRLLDRNMALTRVRGQLVPLLGALAAIGLVILVYVGGRAAAQERIGLDQFVEFSGYLARLVWPTLALGWMLSLMQRGRAAWSRLDALLSTPSKLTDAGTDAGTNTAGGTAVASPGQGRLEVRHLTLSADDRRLVDDVTLTLEPSTVTAIVGRTGSGKSTLVDAICRLVEVPPGTVFLDGNDITTLPLPSLRRAIGYAPQEAFLFSTTIADNIAMGFGEGSTLTRGRSEEHERPAAEPPSPVDARVAAAALAAGLERDLAAMPQGFHTVVGERGITLSGGQRQRVALARAIAAAPTVLVLDDSLSSVDAETEKTILEHLRGVMKGRTSILISHRVAAIKGADQIVVMDQGKVVETGRHDELLKASGVYAELYRTQLEPGGLASGDLPSPGGT